MSLLRQLIIIGLFFNTLSLAACGAENRAGGLSVIKTINLTAEQIDDIINFLLALTDPCVKERACLAPWLPSGPDPDGLQLQATGQDGLPL